MLKSTNFLDKMGISKLCRNLAKLFIKHTVLTRLFNGSIVENMLFDSKEIA